MIFLTNYSSFFKKIRLTERKNFYIILYRKVCAPKGGFLNVKDVSAQKASQKKGAWLQKKNV